MNSIITINESTELHPPKLEFADPIFSILEGNENYFQLWLPWATHMKSLEKVQQFLKESIAFNIGGQKLLYFIVYKGRCIGSVGLVRIHKQHKKAELGYWLHPGMQGQGLMLQSCQQFIDFVFSKTVLNRISISVKENNHASINLAIRLGFSKEGLQKEALFHNNLFYNMVLLGLIKKDWEKS